ncbi:MAG: isopenicillin N synthase family oxygenase [Rhodospirillaceae bacterium]|jgi:isopenicillin N synthase-like dioxygenase|nr:isopenicillin N synthase family oxygenase [Rhodospirillaceae bacterium]
MADSIARRDPELKGARVPFEALPVIDAGALRGPDGPARDAAVAVLGQAAREIGFFYIADHGVSPTHIAGFFDAMRAFFALPEEEKRRTAFGREGKRMGYMAFGQQRTDDDAEGDLVEGYEIGLDLPADDPDADFPFYGPTPWPAEPAGFREAMLGYMDEMRPLGEAVLRALAEGLGLGADAFNPFLEKPILLLSPRRYPPQAGHITRKRLGVGAHTDYGFLTFVLQDAVGGLQVLGADGQWIEAMPLEGSFVCNIGELLENATGGTLRATTHRVINDSGRERYSCPFFFNPSRHARVAPLPALAGAEAVARYAPVEVGLHYEARMRYEY